MRPESSKQILHKALKRMRVTNPKYSLRRFAQQLGISPTFTNKIVAGRKPLPAKYLPKVARCLELDEVSIEKLKAALLRESTAPELMLGLTAKKNNSEAISPFEANQYVNISRSEYVILANWYYPSILDLTTCADFKPDAAWIARRLGISRIQAHQAWQLFCDQGFVENRGGRWIKKIENIRLPTRASEPIVRQYHAQSLGRARQELEKTSQADFDRRLISALSVALDPQNIPKAKLILREAMTAIGSLTNEGTLKEVYQFQVQFYPVTNAEQT